jgi:hypothetical protein
VKTRGGRIPGASCFLSHAHNTRKPLTLVARNLSLSHAPMLSRPLRAAAAAATAVALAAPGPCVAPGTCTPPPASFSRVILDPSLAGVQWETSGGFCGAFSIQHASLPFGAWLSQDLVRRANRDQPGPHHMHGDPTVGYEVMPSNVAYTATALRLSFDEFDYTQPSPQAAAYKAWVKKHLAAGHPVVWFPICKGDP